MRYEIKIGAHMPISKGFHVVPKETREIGGNSFQIFPHNARSWKANLPDRTKVNRFKREMKRHSLDYENAFCHSGYLLNLANPDEEIWKRSVELLKREMRICRELGISYLNIHPGNHMGVGMDTGIDLIVKGLDEAMAEVPDVVILLENVSPKGTAIGFSMEQLGRIVKESSFPDRLGLTYDTCHGFDAGYDIRSGDGVRKLLDEIEENLGLERLKMVHLNDSKFPLGVAKDRHERIGKGHIGREGFKVFLSFDEIRAVPWILETPGGNEEHAEDIETVFEILGIR